MQYEEGRGWSKDRRKAEWDHVRSIAYTNLSVVREWKVEGSLFIIHHPQPETLINLIQHYLRYLEC
jgi:hypothetical protein